MIFLDLINARKNLEAVINQAKAYEDKIESLKKLSESLEELTSEQQRKSSALEAYIQDQQQFSNGIIEMEDIGLEYVPTSTCCSEIEKAIADNSEDTARLIGFGLHLHTTKAYKIDGSEKKGAKFQREYSDNLLIGFNAYVDSKAKAITTANYNHSVNLIEKCFEKYNKRASLLGISLTKEYLNLRLKNLKCCLDLKLAKAEEKERLRKEKAILREQEQLLAEAEKERKRLEDERKAMDIAFAKALSDSERQEIQDKLAEIDKRIADVDYRVNNSKAGWLYVISSDCLKGMIKCGVTRRLNPTLRIKELSSSAVPTPFRTHCFVFSDDCFELESAMHKYFDKQRVTPNKEFFYIKPEEAIEVLKDKFGCEIHFGDEENSDNDE